MWDERLRAVRGRIERTKEFLSWLGGGPPRALHFKRKQVKVFRNRGRMGNGHSFMRQTVGYAMFENGNLKVAIIFVEISM